MRHYDLIRGGLMTGDIVLFSGKGFVSRVIQLFTKSDWSHVGVIVKVNDMDMVLLWESTTLSKLPDVKTGKLTKGVQLVSLSDRVISYNGKIAIRQLTGSRDEATMARIAELRREMTGVPYETSLIELGRSIFKSVFSPVSNLRSVFCSELAAEIYHRAGWMSPDCESSSYTPADFSFDGETLPLREGVFLSKEMRIK